MKEKIKILFLPSDLSGVGHFRSIWPAQEMQKKYKDKFEIKIIPNYNFNNLEALKKYDIIHFHRQLGPFERIDEIYNTLKESNVTLIMDVDDYWSPPTTHPLYQAVKENNITEKITENLKRADYVTTTTNLFANKIKKFNKNVIVMPNAIDTNHKMWKKDESIPKTDKVRVSWIGGSSHLEDLKLIKTSMSRLNNDSSLQDKFQFILCGFDTRGVVTEINQKTNERKQRKIKPHETVWTKFEKLFTSDYKNINDDYKKWLLEYKNEKNPFNQEELNYVRRWTLPLTQYGKHYNYCDICLAPLVENTFNEVKSELKIIEAGLTGKVLIAQDFGIYKELIEDGENGFLVHKTRNHKDWHKKIKYLIENPKEIERISKNLYEFVKDKYNLTSTTESRVEIYEEIYEKNKVVALN